MSNCHLLYQIEAHPIPVLIGTAWHKAPRALTGTSSDPGGINVKFSAGFKAVNACCHVCWEKQSHDGNVAVPGATSIRGFLLDPSHAVLDHQQSLVWLRLNGTQAYQRMTWRYIYSQLLHCRSAVSIGSSLRSVSHLQFLTLTPLAPSSPARLYQILV